MCDKKRQYIKDNENCCNRNINVPLPVRERTPRTTSFAIKIIQCIDMSIGILTFGLQDNCLL